MWAMLSARPPPLPRRLRAVAASGRSFAAPVATSVAWRQFAPCITARVPSSASATAACSFPCQRRQVSPSLPYAARAGAARACAQVAAQAAAQGAADGACEAALEQFRRRAGPELALAAEAVAGGVSSTQLGRTMRIARDDALQQGFGEQDAGGARARCEAAIEEEAEGPAAMAAEIEDFHRERQSLKKARADILAVGFQTTHSENQEFASLIVCATAGIFAVSIHYVFFSIWFFAYMLYRRSTKQTRVQRAAVDDLQGLVERLRQVDEAEQERRAALKMLATAWADGRPG